MSERAIDATNNVLQGWERQLTISKQPAPSLKARRELVGGNCKPLLSRGGLVENEEDIF